MLRQLLCLSFLLNSACGDFEVSDMSNKTQRPFEQVLRTGDTPTRQKELLLKVLDQPADSTQRSIQFSVHVPARRISAYIALFFVPSTPTDTFDISYTNCVWDLWAVEKSPNGESIGLYIVDAAAQVPRVYEVDSAIRDYTVFADLVGPSSGGKAGKWYAKTRFEPNTPMDDKELIDLFNDCKLGF